MIGLPLSEVFGPTIQGEGPAAGRRAWFVRLGGCNLSCSWCDSAYTWDGERFDLREQITLTPVADILAALPRFPVTVVLTGGEPLLNQRHAQFDALLAGMVEAGHQVHVETNGTIEPTWETQQAVSLFVTSPKQAHAGRHRGHQSAEPWPGWPGVSQAVVKIVVTGADGVAEAVRTALLAGWDCGRIWVMPEGTDTVTLNERWPDVAAAAARLGVNASHRLHVLAWGDERGH